MIEGQGVASGKSVLVLQAATPEVGEKKFLQQEGDEGSTCSEK